MPTSPDETIKPFDKRAEPGTRHRWVQRRRRREKLRFRWGGEKLKKTSADMGTPMRKCYEEGREKKGHDNEIKEAREEGTGQENNC